MAANTPSARQLPAIVHRLLRTPPFHKSLAQAMGHRKNRATLSLGGIFCTLFEPHPSNGAPSQTGHTLAGGIGRPATYIQLFARGAFTMKPHSPHMLLLQCLAAKPPPRRGCSPFFLEFLFFPIFFVQSTIEKNSPDPPPCRRHLFTIELGH